MKLAMIPEEQCRWMEQWRQIRALRSVQKDSGNPESERELAEQRVLFQKLHVKSKS